MNKLEQWALATQKHEGFYEGSRSQRNNNPGNIRFTAYSSSLGANKGKDDKNFVIYETYEIGFNALKQFLIDACTNKLRSYKSDMTLLEFYGKYAPSSDGNSPKNYASFIAGELGVTIDTKIGDLITIEDTNMFEKCPRCGYPDEPQTGTPLEYYWQRHPRYKGLKLGPSNLSFQNYACLTCSLAYVTQEDPLVVHDKLKAGGGYLSDGRIISEKAAEILNLEYKGKTKDVNYMPDWTPTIKEVKLGSSQHFVVRLIDKYNPVASKTYGTLIFDPWVGKYLGINYYNFISYRLFKQK